MSASLVGSEMCIRDSCRASWPRPSTRRRLVVGPPQPPARTHAHTHRDKPVSYTHLTLPTICSV
eukprot:1230612-Alexandrium_andersonii.AAC.1